MHILDCVSQRYPLLSSTNLRLRSCSVRAGLTCCLGPECKCGLVGGGSHSCRAHLLRLAIRGRQVNECGELGWWCVLHDQVDGGAHQWAGNTRQQDFFGISHSLRTPDCLPHSRKGKEGVTWLYLPTSAA
eukprot:1140399-Pelagomonas_calceolata.AAC.2